MDGVAIFDFELSSFPKLSSMPLISYENMKIPLDFRISKYTIVSM
ncbi:hypothetical protein MtrunA17_Chr2g0289681 [Medicago truncatula]|uniref:Uncharacterized protein n=1 Tax=Medicago truncatula TaxID=3880 RepID=A0A396J7Q4_MEDTR|nr:hypothetical protein MtrunA17_Chr2g0289681 [Medicago truncatula]